MTITNARIFPAGRADRRIAFFFALGMKDGAAAAQQKCSLDVLVRPLPSYGVVAGEDPDRRNLGILSGVHALRSSCSFIPWRAGAARRRAFCKWS
jgi:hypothetical protein